MAEPDSADGRTLIGDVIAGKYRIDSVAGEGGMGIVYEAEHVILRQRVALKVLVPGMVAPTDAIERFSLEAAAIARIASEHVVRVMDAGSLPSGAPYLVMEYLDGCDLEQLLRERGRMPPAVVVDFALQSLEALAHAHAARVIHRDLKPANLFLARSADGREIIKLVDFGISKAFDLSSEDDRVVGSPAYMSPEQLRKAPLDLRTDLWSLGVVMYELLSGAPPFSGSFSDVVTAILNQDAVPLAQRSPTIPPDLSEIVATCLKRDPEARWSSTARLARALAPHGTGAWAGVLERIDRVLTKSTPLRAPRRFETFDNALQALESGIRRGNDVATLAPPPEGEEVIVPSASATNPPSPSMAVRAGIGATMPAPAKEPEAATRSAAPETVAPESTRSTLRILLIDESESALRLHEEALSMDGFAVRTTTSEPEFDRLLGSFRPHLVLVDMQMHRASGDELCRRVKARFGATVPVVGLSDSASDELAERIPKGGADAFFRKTKNAEAFVDFVRNICAITYSPEDLP
jgi:serine/threonine-protein kinase